MTSKVDANRDDCRARQSGSDGEFKCGAATPNGIIDIATSYYRKSTAA